MKKSKVFAVIMVIGDEEHLTFDTVSIHSKEIEAHRIARELQNNHTEENSVVFDVLDYVLDEEPVLLEFYKKQKKIIREQLEKSIESLVKGGFLEQLVGEDGYFYYELSQKGKENASKLMDKLPEYLRKRFEE